MGKSVSDAKVIDILDSIYGTVTGESSWQTVTDQIFDEFPFSSVIMHGYDSQLNQCRLETSGQLEREFTESYVEHYHLISPWIGAHEAQKTGAVYTTEDIDIDLPRDHPEFFHDWVMPAGKGSATAIKIFGQPHYYETINIDYPFGTDHKYNDIVAPLLRTLAPHLQRALDMQRNLKILSGGQKNFETLLQKLPSPALLLTPHCHVEWMNDAASDALRQNRGVTLGPAGKLVLETRADNENLARAVLEASNRSSGGIHQPLGTFPFHASQEPAEPNLVSVIPMQGTQQGSDAHLARFFTPSWRALVLIRYRADKPVLPMEQLRMAFGLTIAESRVVQALVRDMNTDEIAQHLNLSRNTVRNHIKRVLAKTGSRRQSELVHLVLGLLTII